MIEKLLFHDEEPALGLTVAVIWTAIAVPAMARLKMLVCKGANWYAVFDMRNIR